MKKACCLSFFFYMLIEALDLLTMALEFVVIGLSSQWARALASSFSCTCHAA